MTRIRELVPGQRPTALAINEMARELRASRLHSGAGASVSRTPMGSTLTSQVEKPVPVFLVKSFQPVDDDDEPNGMATLLGKEPFRTIMNDEDDPQHGKYTGPWRVPPGEPGVVGFPWHGYRIEDFKRFFLADPDVVGPNDVAVEFLDGFYRFPSDPAFQGTLLVRVGYVAESGTPNEPGHEAERITVTEVALNGDLIPPDLEAAPWPGQKLSDYKNKQNITMLAHWFEDKWVVQMTGDRPYVPFPADTCEVCT